MEVVGQVLEAQKDFVTVVAVGTGGEEVEVGRNVEEKAFVTVLTIGDDQKEVCEEVLVYRLPGERLGFGLKFEGGTKTSECVRRLFIQSCAPDSPASRVKSTWGSLGEGDEVVEIDSQPVKNMTRIDCVRCLKDSNVVIKLLVRHNGQPILADSDQVDGRVENLPLVVKAEKKRLPPPPPVPPRKVTRKSKDGAVAGSPPRAEDVENGLDDKYRPAAPSSPRNPVRTPPRARDRRLSEGSNGPPDAEVYLDLLSQELEYGQRAESESDDTGSTISTVMDKHANSCFSERCSIASDSIPSTPTPKQKQLDLSKVLNSFEILEMEFEPNNNQFDDYKLGNSDMIISEIRTNGKSQEKSPANFQDAHLSYGNEDVKTISRSTEIINNNVHWPESEERTLQEMNKLNKTHDPPQPPKPTPRKCYAKKSPQKQELDEKPILPRLVNVIPKTPTLDSEMFELPNGDLEKFEPVPFEEGNSYLSLDIVSLEKISDFRTGIINDCGKECEEIGCDDDDDVDDVDDKFFVFKWSSSGQLATIGEDEEFEPSECVLHK